MKKAALCKVAAVVTISGLLFAGCNTPASNTQLGSTTGAVLGGVIGHQFGKGRGKTAATVAGAIAGSLIGGNIGAQMDARDRQYVSSALNTNRPTSWQNPNTGYSYTATPGNTYQGTYQGQPAPCQPVTVVARLPNGQQQNVQMNACRSSNGTWQATS